MLGSIRKANMGRREGTVDERVRVAVSEFMYRLRLFQNVFNGFWQSTELCYGYLLSRTDTDFSNPDQKMAEVLGHVPSQVWYPNNQGRIKRDETIAKFLTQIQQNTVHVYRAALLSFYSAFEAYLNDRVGSVTGSRDRWGPFLESLKAQQLQRAGCPLQLRTVLCADICRKMRNMIVHDFMKVPADLNDQSVSNLKRSLMQDAQKHGWSNDPALDVTFALNQVVGQANSHMKQAANEGKSLPIELFYMLFTFTNLDSLAFEIEEALITAPADVHTWVWRKKDAVRRKDLILPIEAGSA
jgi:hypothetical protein